MPRMPGTRDQDAQLAEALEHHLDEGRLICPHCRQRARPASIKAATTATHIGLGNIAMPDPLGSHQVIVVICAGCDQEVVYARRWRQEVGGEFGDRHPVTDWIVRVRPLGRGAKPFMSPEAARFVGDYEAACRTVEVSPEASACMSRRCLQEILRSQGYSQKDLNRQIEAVLKESDPAKVLPGHISKDVDYIRNFGNFGAHAKPDLRTSEIIPVEQGEAEWCIEIVEDLLVHYFEQPAERDAKRAAADAKFAAARKPTQRAS